MDEGVFNVAVRDFVQLSSNRSCAHTSQRKYLESDSGGVQDVHQSRDVDPVLQIGRVLDYLVGHDLW